MNCPICGGALYVFGQVAARGIRAQWFVAHEQKTTCPFARMSHVFSSRAELLAELKQLIHYTNYHINRKLEWMGDNVR